MSNKGLFGCWFCMLTLCFLVPPGLAQVLDPAQCLISGIFNLIRLPESKDGLNCWQDCYKEPDCHMAVMTRPLSGSEQCLLVNCLNQGQHSQPRDPSELINIYPKSTLDDEQRKYLMTGYGYGLAEETFRCHDDVNMASYSSCRSGTLRFFYNRTSYRCERFLSGCGSNRNSFMTQEGCEALCSEKYLCYRPVEHGQRPPLRFDDSRPDDDMSVHNFFFYNVSSRRCDGFYFRGSASNGNLFRTVEECQNLCGDVKASAETVPPANAAATTAQAAVDSAVLSVVSLLVLVLLLLALVFVGVATVKFFRVQRSSAISDRKLLLSHSDE